MKLFFLGLLVFLSLSTEAKAESFNCSQVPIEKVSECFNQKLQQRETETPKLMSRGSAQQLEGVKGRNLSEWSWGIGGEAPYSGEKSVYEITNYSGLEFKVQSRSEDWTNLNRGDSAKGSVKIPIVRF